MQRIKNLIDYCEKEGLPSDRTQLHSTLIKLKDASNIPEVESILWGDAKGHGLLSDLEVTNRVTAASVTEAWKACSDAVAMIETFEKVCAGVISDSQDTEGAFVQTEKFALALEGVWQTFTNAYCALKNARQGQEASTKFFLQFLSQRNDARFERFRNDVNALERDYDNGSQQRFLLENFYEVLRVWNKKPFKSWASEDWINFDPFYVKNYRWEDKTNQCQPDYKDTSFYQRFAPEANERLGKRARGMVLRLEGDKVIQTPESQQVLHDLEKDFFIFVAPYCAVSVHEFIPFCRVWYQMQGVLNTLSGADGLWRKDDDNAKARAAVAIRDKLATSLEYLEDIEESLNALNRNPTLVNFEAVISDLQDLSANILYGDDDDQRAGLQAFIASAKEWTSVFDKANNFFKTEPVFFDIHDHIGVAEVFNRALMTQNAPRGLNWDQVVMAFEKIDLDNQRLYSLIARKDEQHGVPTIETYRDPNAMPIGARARMLELPKSHACEFGRVNNGNRSRVGEYYEIPINFANEYASDPKVVCWLEGFQVNQSMNLRVRAEIDRVTKNGCVVRMGSWIDTELHHIDVVWFAHAADHPHIVSGRGSRFKYGKHSDEWAPYVSVDFPTDKFPKRRPHVFLAISLLDMDHQFYSRCELRATNVTQLGIKISMDAWLDTYCYQADFTYLAFDDNFFGYQLK
ncbi:hypothetical protein FSARC_13129 [Fusarium sarcochroum]|uniref:H-type lectin domain-containing protein n=1 Tax=Fusarium sarcochroum TaxID=1208366 RepID=A0A8H4T3H5_9HYPO|nr:hypothetical protein FSARC_13129 [Fusarium sarcochroum]